jgi:hypothetical protein
VEALGWWRGGAARSPLCAVLFASAASAPGYAPRSCRPRARPRGDKEYFRGAGARRQLHFRNCAMSAERYPWHFYPGRSPAEGRRRGDFGVVSGRPLRRSRGPRTAVPGELAGPRIPARHAGDAERPGDPAL